MGSFVGHRGDSGPFRQFLQKLRIRAFLGLRGQTRRALEKALSGNVLRPLLQQLARQVCGLAELLLRVRGPCLLIELRLLDAELRHRLPLDDLGRRGGDLVPELPRRDAGTRQKRRPLRQNGLADGHSLFDLALARIASNDLINLGRLLLALHLHQVQLPANETVRHWQLLAGRGGAKDPHTVGLAKALQATRKIHGIAHTAKLHLSGQAADVAGEDFTSVDANTDGQRRQAQLSKLFVERAQRLLLRQGSCASLRRMSLDIIRCVPKGKDPVAENLPDDAFKGLNHPRHEREVHGQQKNQIILFQLFRDGGEVSDIREHDGDFLPEHMQTRGLGVPRDEPPHHRVRHEAREDLDGV
mmetsp:Transcript_97245/g.231386  ORF Transcript_97245/g.231386 Transcript_97245/m.231386 type:complete len:357 (-) Transcript_97245:1233-2303(-)